MSRRLRPVRPEWVPDSQALVCADCKQSFTVTRRRHHCRYCGQVFCADCSSKTARMPPHFDYSGFQRVCERCFTELTEYANVVEQENLTLQYALRNMPQYQLDMPLIEIGSRGIPDKSFFLVRDDARNSLLVELVTTSNGVVSMSGETAQRVTTTLLKGLQHPFIIPTQAVHFLVEQPKVLIVREWCPKGSLRDLIYREDPREPFGRKYRSRGTGLGKARIATIGRQILEALVYMKSKQWPMPHLHAGNVVMRDGTDACLTDYENTLLGLTPHYDGMGVDGVEPELLCFGRLLFECAMGYAMPVQAPLEAAAQSADMPVPVYEVLKRIFAPGTDGPATVESLLAMPYFQSVQIKADVRYMVQACLQKLVFRGRIRPPFEPKANALLKVARQKAPSITVAPPPAPEPAPAAAGSATAAPAPTAAGGPTLTAEEEEERRRRRLSKRRSRAVTSADLSAAAGGSAFLFEAGPTAQVPKPTPATPAPAKPAAAAPAAPPATAPSAPPPPPATAAAPKSAAAAAAAAAAPAVRRGGPPPPAPPPAADLAPAAAPAVRRGGPPPPAPPPPSDLGPAAPSELAAEQPGRSALLASIRNPGIKLKKVQPPR